MNFLNYNKKRYNRIKKLLDEFNFEPKIPIELYKIDISKPYNFRCLNCQYLHQNIKLINIIKKLIKCKCQETKGHNFIIKDNVKDKTKRSTSSNSIDKHLSNQVIDI